MSYAASAVFNMITDSSSTRTAGAAADLAKLFIPASAEIEYDDDFKAKGVHELYLPYLSLTPPYISLTSRYTSLIMPISSTTSKLRM